MQWHSVVVVVAVASGSDSGLNAEGAHGAKSNLPHQLLGLGLEEGALPPPRGVLPAHVCVGGGRVDGCVCVCVSVCVGWGWVGCVCVS